MATPKTPDSTAAPALTEAQVAEIRSNPQVQIIVDEAVNQTRAYVDERVKETANKVNAPASAMDNPNLKRWIGTQGSGPLTLVDGASNGPVSGRMTVGEAIEAGYPALRFIGDEDVQAWMRRGAKGKSPRMQVGALFSNNPSARSASIGTASNIVNVLSTLLEQEITVLPQREMRTRDLLTVIPTDNEQIKYLRETAFTNNANTVPMSQLDPMTAVGAPQSTVTYTEETAVAKMISHYFPCPKSYMSDIATLINAVETKGKLGVFLKEDTQIVGGSGSGDDLPGLTTDAGIAPIYQWSTGDPGDNMADAILMAIALQFLNNYSADGVVLHPWDHMKLAKMKNSFGNYLLPGSFVEAVMGDVGSLTSTMRIWGLNSVRTTAMNIGSQTALASSVTGFGKALVGAFKTAAILYDLEQVEMEIFDQHADWATKNLLALYFYERLALANKRPDAFRLVEFDAAPNT